MMTMKTSSLSCGPDRYADIMLDDWFKRSFKEFGDAKRLMLLFLQTLIPERKIASITFTSEESTNQNPDKKGVRVDVECTDESGNRFLVEVQQAKQSDFYDRAVFDSTFAIQRQLEEGADEYGFAPVYFIGIMRFSLHPDSKECLYRYSLKEDNSGELMTDHLHYIFLEVTKCRLASKAPLIEKVGYALNHMAEFKERPEGFDGEFFDLLFKSADFHTFAPEEKIKYHYDMTTERDIRNQIKYAHDEGKADGKAEGLAEGRDEERQRIAKAMLADGLAPEQVARYSGLTPEQLEKLHDQKGQPE